MTTLTTTRRRPRPRRAVLDKLSPRSFKAIPDDAPAKELGEYLRQISRETTVPLERIAAAGGMALNTLTTTMDGRSKSWPSVQNWINAYTKAVGPLYARQMDEIERRYKAGRANHEARLKSGDPSRAPQTVTSVENDPATFLTTWASLAGKAPTQVVVAIKLPRRTPGAGIDPVNKKFLSGSEIDARVRYLKTTRPASKALPKHPSTPRNAPRRAPARGPAHPWTQVHYDNTHHSQQPHPAQPPETNAEPEQEHLPNRLTASWWEQTETIPRWLSFTYPLLLIGGGIGLLANDGAFGAFAMAGTAMIISALLVWAVRALSARSWYYVPDRRARRGTGWSPSLPDGGWPERSRFLFP
jgi:hypothetical protein